MLVKYLLILLNHITLQEVWVEQEIAGTTQ